jgi:hypothetical protein
MAFVRCQQLEDVDRYRARLTDDEIKSRKHMSANELGWLRAVVENPSALLEHKARALEELVLDEDTLAGELAIKELQKTLEESRAGLPWIACLIRACEGIINSGQKTPANLDRALHLVAERLKQRNSPAGESGEQEVLRDTFCRTVRALSLVLPREKAQQLVPLLKNDDWVMRQSCLQGIDTIFRPDPPRESNAQNLQGVGRAVQNEVERALEADLRVAKYIAYCSVAFEATAVLGLKVLPEFAGRLHKVNKSCVRFVTKHLNQLRGEWGREGSHVAADHPARLNLEQCLKRLTEKTS